MQPMTGIRVLDLSQYVPGPFCTLICRRLGADVVKLERPETGDPLRDLDAEAFEALNAGKRSIVINLKNPEGIQAVLRLIERADVLVESFRPGVTQRLGLAYAQLKKRHPELIYASISGYGQTGNFTTVAGHDLNYMALAGALGEPPAVPGIQVADFAGGGLYATIAILGALMERRRTGEGRHLDVSMSEGVESLTALTGVELLRGHMPSYSLYRTADGQWLSVAAVEPKFWVALCEAIGRPELALRHRDPSARSEVEKIFSERNLAEWLRIFEGRQVCVMAVSGHGSTAPRHRVGQGPNLDERPWLGVAEPNCLAPALGLDEQAILVDWGLARDG